MTCDFVQIFVRDVYQVDPFLVIGLGASYPINRIVMWNYFGRFNTFDTLKTMLPFLK